MRALCKIKYQSSANSSTFGRAPLVERDGGLIGRGPLAMRQAVDGISQCNGGDTPLGFFAMNLESLVDRTVAAGVGGETAGRTTTP